MNLLNSLADHFEFRWLVGNILAFCLSTTLFGIFIGVSAVTIFRANNDSELLNLFFIILATSLLSLPIGLVQHLLLKDFINMPTSWVLWNTLSLIVGLTLDSHLDITFGWLLSLAMIWFVQWGGIRRSVRYSSVWALVNACLFLGFGFVVFWYFALIMIGFSAVFYENGTGPVDWILFQTILGQIIGGGIGLLAGVVTLPIVLWLHTKQPRKQFLQLV